VASRGGGRGHCPLQAQEITLLHTELKAKRIWARGALRRGDVVLLAAAVFWALNLAIGKYALSHGFSPLAYAGPRNAIAGTVFLLVAGRRGEVTRLERRDLRLIPVAAILGIVIDQLAFIYGLHEAQATVIGLVFGSTPVITAVIASAAGAERVSRRGWLAATVSTSGIALVALGAPSALGGDSRGAGFALLSTLAFAAYAVVLLPLLKRYSVVYLSGLVNLAAAIPIMAAATPSFVHEDWERISLLAWLAWSYGLVFSYILGNFLWMAGLHLVGASRAAIYANAQPFLGAAFAVVLLSERLSVIQSVGGVIVLLSIVIGGRTVPLSVAE
jgi:drug/metabolite transporter (DMT)-like permease